MGLTIALFIPDAIVLASDSLAEVRQNDDGYLGNVEKVFVLNNQHVVALEGEGFYHGLPFSYYVNQILNEKETQRVNNTLELSSILNCRLASVMPGSFFSGYVAGYDFDKGCFTPTVALLDHGVVSVINQDSSGRTVYNFHAIGRNHWVNKLLMPASLKNGDEDLIVPSYNIDFSKYSVFDAIEFANEIISLSEKLDKFSQLKPMIGGKHQIVSIRPFSGVSIEVPTVGRWS